MMDWIVCSNSWDCYSKADILSEKHEAHFPMGSVPGEILIQLNRSRSVRISNGRIVNRISFPSTGSGVSCSSSMLQSQASVRAKPESAKNSSTDTVTSARRLNASYSRMITPSPSSACFTTSINTFSASVCTKEACAVS